MERWGGRWQPLLKVINFSPPLGLNVPGKSRTEREFQKKIWSVLFTYIREFFGAIDNHLPSAMENHFCEYKVLSKKDLVDAEDFPAYT